MSKNSREVIVFIERIQHVAEKCLFLIARIIFRNTIREWNLDLLEARIFDEHYCKKSLETVNVPLLIGFRAKNPSPFHDFRPVGTLLQRVARPSPYSAHNLSSIAGQKSPFAHEVFVLDSDRKELEQGSVSVHFHVHHTSIADEVFQRLGDQLAGQKIWITCTSADLENSIRGLQSFKRAVSLASKSSIEEVPNHGRDIYPFLTLPDEFWDSGVALHLHTKSPSPAYDDWREFLFTNLIGNEHNPNFMRNAFALKTNQEWGMIYPRDPHILGWGRNYRNAHRMAAKIGIDLQQGRFSTFDFPVGNMFMFKPRYLKRLRELMSGEIIPLEPIAKDGTVLHAFERLTPFFVTSNGGRVLHCHQPGEGR